MSTTSTVSSINLQKADNYSDASTKNSEIQNTVEGATTIASAAADNIATDGSSINTSESSTLSLAGAAQQNAAAINLVNAADSLVANGVNIARTTNMNTTPTLNQVNSISQVH
jgi:hypothetical protein